MCTNSWLYEASWIPQAKRRLRQCAGMRRRKVDLERESPAKPGSLHLC